MSQLSFFNFDPVSGVIGDKPQNGMVNCFIGSRGTK